MSNATIDNLFLAVVVKSDSSDIVTIVLDPCSEPYRCTHQSIAQLTVILCV